jgi:hypothetical protein
MTLRPTIVSPATMGNARVRKSNAVAKKMVIDCKNESQWLAIHEQPVNGVVLRRRPIRAIETYLDNAPDAVFQSHEFTCSQAGLRKELEKHLVLISEDEEIRRKFLINDILKWSRVMISQTRSREYLYKICSDLPSAFVTSPSSLCMFVTYRGQEITFRQPKDTDIRSFSPYGAGLFRGDSYSRTESCSVEWYGTKTGDRAFYMTMEPYSKRARR